LRLLLTGNRRCLQGHHTDGVHWEKRTIWFWAPNAPGASRWGEPPAIPSVRARRPGSKCRPSDEGSVLVVAIRARSIGRLTAFDPKATFKIGPLNGPEAQESSLWLKASVAPVIVGRPTW
jgi:hypothetical protein